MKTQRIGILGLGWVGSQFRKYFEEVRGLKRGSTLLLYDIDPKKNFSDDLNTADVVFVCLPTPRNANDGSCDISIVEEGIKKLNGDGKIVVIKSTAPPGTTEAFQKKYPKHTFLFSPEFLTESNAWENFIHPDRQIVGFARDNKDAALTVLSLLPQAAFMSPTKENSITATEAEFIKYAGNVYLARKVNLANVFAKAAEKLGANYDHIRIGMAADQRIGKSHLDVTHGGYRGFGGYCFPKDLDAFIHFAKAIGFEDGAQVLEADRKFNEDLLQSQGLTVAEVSVHKDALDKKFKS